MTNIISTIRQYSHLVKTAQTIENKWRHGADQHTSDQLGYAPCDDNKADYRDNPYATPPASHKPDNAQAVQKLKGLVNDCLDAVGLLLTDPKYQHSTGLAAFNQNLPAVVDMINDANGLDVAEIQGTLGSLSFYADPANKGTGFDPATQIRTGKYLSPADYLKQISSIVNSIKQ